MREFDYVIKDETGIHARPAGLLAKTARELESTVTISKGEKSAVVTKIMAVMGMSIRCGDTVKITIEGGNEEHAEKIIKNFFEENL